MHGRRDIIYVTFGRVARRSQTAPESFDVVIRVEHEIVISILETVRTISSGKTSRRIFSTTNNGRTGRKIDSAVVGKTLDEVHY